MIRDFCRFVPNAMPLTTAAAPVVTNFNLSKRYPTTVIGMILADRVAQCRAPLVIADSAGRIRILCNTANFAEVVARCAVRYVLADELTRLCADLAYSEGARSVAYADILHMPATTFWLEWCDGPWREALRRYGFSSTEGACQYAGRRGALVTASADGRRGLVRTFWTVAGGDHQVLASSVEAYFDFDTPEGEEPVAPDRQDGAQTMQVRDELQDGSDDVLKRCFRFRYEPSWREYYGQAGLTGPQNAALWRHTLGTIAVDVPMLLAFALLLSTRNGLPQRMSNHAYLNQKRKRVGKTPLLDHVEVRAPMLPEYVAEMRAEHRGARRSPRLHHVRGHLVRRGSQLFWRMPHLRGSARVGVVRTRTVVWTLEQRNARRGAAADGEAHECASRGDLVSIQHDGGSQPGGPFDSVGAR